MATTTVNSPRDPNTLSNYNNFRTTHTTANLDILFDRQQVVGNVVHQLKSITNAESDEIILDSSYLDVSCVKVDGKTSKWELLPRLEPYGSALKIHLGRGVPLGKVVEVDVCFDFIL
jgi:leukotriene-A4 hydrolase